MVWGVSLSSVTMPAWSFHHCTLRLMLRSSARALPYRQLLGDELVDQLFECGASVAVTFFAHSSPPVLGLKVRVRFSSPCTRTRTR